MAGWQRDGVGDQVPWEEWPHLSTPCLVPYTFCFGASSSEVNIKTRVDELDDSAKKIPWESKLVGAMEGKETLEIAFSR